MKRRRPSGGRAVQESRAPTDTPAEDPLRALYRKLEFFPTPPWAARACAHFIKTLDPGAEIVREPACGQGHFVLPLREYFPTVLPSDIYDFGCGEVSDYLAEPFSAVVDWMITNPPFPLAARFVKKGLRTSTRGVAIVARLAFLETIGRYELVHGTAGCSHVVVFSERVPMQLGEWNPEADTATAYALFVWQKCSPRGGPFLRAFPPGTEKLYTHPADRRLFTNLPPPPFEPLFDMQAR